MPQLALIRWTVERKAGDPRGDRLTEGSWLVVNVLAHPRGFLRYTGWLSADAGERDGVLALIVAAMFTATALGHPY